VELAFEIAAYPEAVEGHEHTTHVSFREASGLFDALDNLLHDLAVKEF
jgi:hypothetical protein